MDAMVGLLALVTLGGAIVIGAFLFVRSNRDPKNREITKTVIEDGSSAHTAVRGGKVPDHMQ